MPITTREAMVWSATYALYRKDLLRAPPPGLHTPANDENGKIAEWEEGVLCEAAENAWSAVIELRSIESRLREGCGDEVADMVKSMTDSDSAAPADEWSALRAAHPELDGSLKAELPATGPPLVVVESPYAGAATRNRRYLQLCLRDCFARGEAPFASHGLYPGALDDTKLDEREQGITAGYAWGRFASKVAIYADFGISAGMARALDHWRVMGVPVEFRRILRKPVSEDLWRSRFPHDDERALVSVAVLPVSEDEEALVDALVRDARRGRKSKPLVDPEIEHPDCTSDDCPARSVLEETT